MARGYRVRSATKLVASIALIGVCMFSAPALVGFVAEAQAASMSLQSVSLGLPDEIATTAKIPSTDAPQIDLAVTQPKKTAPLPVVLPKPKATAKAYSSKTASTATRRTTTRTSTSGSELSRARAILASMIARHPILAGTTVSFGSTPGGYQAVAYYKSGRILISPTHTSSLDRIITHECWHIIDWRDNGRIDWGENVPPR